MSCMCLESPMGHMTVTMSTKLVEFLTDAMRWWGRGCVRTDIFVATDSKQGYHSKEQKKRTN